MQRVLLSFIFAVVLRASAPCPRPTDIQPDVTLQGLATKYFGKPSYDIAIALATNSRTDQGFPYISNPYNIANVTRVCIPSKAEARQLSRSWTAYQRAIDTARLPGPSSADKDLLTIASDAPVNVVAWVRKDQADRLKTASGGWVETAQAETWITVEPHLQEMCRDFTRTRGADENKLTARLEQRLGLAPASSKAFFVRMRLDHPDAAELFRPCADSAADKANCAAGPPTEDSTGRYQSWFYQQYYSSYGKSLISEVPWTALGYTFDWAPALGIAFQRIGESEFVIRAGAPIHITEVVPTPQYCH